MISLKNSRGQGMTEYIIIVALIAVAAIGVFRFYGNTVRGQVGVAAAELAGQNSATAKAAANAASTSANLEGAKPKTLANFNGAAH